MIAFFKSFSCPWISFRSSGIEVKPKREKRTTPIGRVKFCRLYVVRFVSWICGKKLMKIPMMTVIIRRTPHVSIPLSPRIPLRSKRVKIIQKKNAKMTGEVPPGMIWARDSPSPIR